MSTVARHKPNKIASFCVLLDHDLEHPPLTKADVDSDVASIKVRAECLKFALGDPDALDHGIWGGTSAGERRRMRRSVA